MLEWLISNKLSRINLCISLVYFYRHYWKCTVQKTKQKNIVRAKCHIRTAHTHIDQHSPLRFQKQFHYITWSATKRNSHCVILLPSQQTKCCQLLCYVLPCIEPLHVLKHINSHLSSFLKPQTFYKGRGSHDSGHSDLHLWVTISFNLDLWCECVDGTGSVNRVKVHTEYYHVRWWYGQINP